MNLFGLIGKNISYSYSQNYFTSKFEQEQLQNCSYEIFDLEDIKQITELLENKDLKGFNVTIPYKEQILPYLDELSPEASAIGAVNCVRIQNNRLKGYNTDAFGFEHSLKSFLDKQDQKALILGDGGAAKAVRYVLSKLNIPFLTVSRKGEFTFSDLRADTIRNHLIIINCTPVGTFPNLNEAPEIPYNYIGQDHLLYDLIYNPEKTKFLNLGEQQGAKIKNGHEMLILQAEKSWEIWHQLL